MPRAYKQRRKIYDWPPNLILIIEAYERVVEDLIAQRNRQNDIIFELGLERMRLLDAIGSSWKGKMVVCDRCKNNFRANKVNTKWCKKCAKIGKKEQDHERYITKEKEARRVARIAKQLKKVS